MKFEVKFTGQYGSISERLTNCYLIRDGGRDLLVKNPGFAVHNTPAAGSVGSAIAIWTSYLTGSSLVTAFGGTNSAIYIGMTSNGTITGVARSFTETSLGMAIPSSDGTAWILTAGAASAAAATITGDTHTNTTIDAISAGDIAKLSVGQAISGTGIQALTRIATVGATSITTTLATTATNAGITITIERLAKIIDTDFPSNSVGDFVNLDGFTCILAADQKLWASDSNTLSGWTSNSFDTTNEYPDAGIGAVRFKNFVMVFSKASIEFWYNAGLTPFPLARSKNLTIKVGAVSASAIATIADNVFWCGPSDKGGLAIFHYDGTYNPISTPQINKEITSSLGSASPQPAGTSDVTVSAMRYEGRSFVYVYCSTATFIYCVEDKRWHKRSATSPLWNKAAGQQTGSDLSTYALSTISTGGKVYVIDPGATQYTDDATVVSSTASSEAMTAGGAWMFFNFLRLIVNPVVTFGSSIVTVSASDDGGTTFNTLGTIDLSGSATKRIDRLGASQNRIWKLAHASNVGFTIQGAVGEMEVGN